MKINTSGLERYQSIVQSLKGEGALTKGGAAKTTAGNTDKVTISGDAAAHAELSRAVSLLATETDGAVSAEALAQLQQAVQAGTYYVSSQDIADAILNVKA